jgi:tRNA (mo5U34)-methyltransferase
MAFVENDLLADPTNWWLPNEACLSAMLRSSGMKIIHAPAQGTFICEPNDSNDDFLHASELRSATGTSDLK